MSEIQTPKPNVRFSVTIDWWFAQGRDLPEKWEAEIRGTIKIEIIGQGSYELNWEKTRNSRGDEFVRLISNGEELAAVDPYRQNSSDTSLWLIAYVIYAMAVENNRDDAYTHTTYYDCMGKVRSMSMPYSKVKSWACAKLHQEELEALTVFCQQI